MKRVCTTVLLSGISLLAAAKTINSNSSGELGILNGPAPGFKFENIQIGNRESDADPGRIYYPLTVNGGNPGRCVMVPGYKGLRSYRLSLEDFYIYDACEVEISFDAKAAPNENGSYTPNQSFRIDFRANTDGDRDRYYPMLSGFAFRSRRQMADLLQTIQDQGLHQLLQHLGPSFRRQGDQHAVSGQFPVSAGSTPRQNRRMNTP